MKRLFFILAAVCMTASVMAQHEIGVIAGGINGLSYKYWISNNLAFQADLAVGLTAAPGAAYLNGTCIGRGTNAQYDFTLNPNIAYHAPLTNHMFVYIGGGANVGMLTDLNNTNPNSIIGKCGANGIVGFEWNAGQKTAIALDFRPGYGLGFKDVNTALFHYFDWKLGLAVRYRI